MSIYQSMRNFWQKYFLVEVPEEFVSAFRRSSFFVNIKRFAVQAAVIAGMDIIFIGIYLTAHTMAWRFWWEHVLLHAVSIVFMSLAIFYFYNFSAEDYDNNSFWQKNIGVIFPLAFAALEILHFMTSPGGANFYLRLALAAFVVGVVPIVTPQKIFWLQLVIFLCCFYYMPTSLPWQSLTTFSISTVMNVCVLTLLASLLSAVAYYANVAAFVGSKKQKQLCKALEVSQKKLEALSCHDNLTGLERRKAFVNYMQVSWAAERENNSTISIILLEMDFLKNYNDRFGYISGDECIAQISHIIENEVDLSEYMLSRVSGGKFAIVAYNKNHASIVTLAETIRKKVVAFELSNSESEISLYVTISAGVTTQHCQSFVDYNGVAAIADKCLGLARQNGHNQIVQIYLQEGEYRDAADVLLEVTKGEEFKRENFSAATKDIAKVIQEVSADVSYIYYRREKLFEFSDKAVEILGLPKYLEPPTLKKFISYIADDYKEQFFAYFKTGMKNKEPFLKINTVLMAGEGEKIPVHIFSRCFFSESGRLEVAAGDIAIMHNLLDYGKFISQQADLDALTMLPNRGKLQRDLAELLSAKDNFGQIILFDIKNFKFINKMHSHNIGDKLLLEVAVLLQELLKDVTRLYYYSVGQYAIILEREDEKQAAKIVEKVQKYFASQIIKIRELSFVTHFATAVVGWRTGEMSLEEIHLALDVTILKAKTDNKENVAFFNETAMESYLSKLKVEKEVIEAAEDGFNGFLLHYQPIISADKEARVVGAEALVRWRDREGKIVPPAIVVPAIEKAGIVAALECWLFETVCKQCSQWIKAGIKEDFFVQINISTLQISRPTLASELFAAISKCGLENANIILEVTEGSLIMEMQQAIATLSDLREQGVGIAVDDFGTGYSSLSYLRTLPVDEIKIDRSFVRNIEDDLMARDFLGSIIKLSKSTGKAVCVEGVETPGQSQILSKLKVDYMQGFLFAKPLPAEDFYNKYFDMQVGELEDAL